MGGCEIVDYASKTSRSEERLVVDLAMIGHNFSQPGSNDVDDSDTLNVVKNSELSLMETEKLINNNSSSGSGNNNNYEYANLIEGMINNVMESATNIKSMDKENNNNNNDNSFEFFNYDSSQIVELTTADSSAPVIISLQNFYDPLNTSETTTQINHFQPTANLSLDGTENSSSPGSAIDMDNEHNQYCNLDTYKVYRESLNGITFPDVQTVQSERTDLGVRSLGNFDTFFEFDSLGQRLVPHTNRSMTSMVTEDFTQTMVAHKRKKRERKILSNWEKEKRISCSLCSKKFRTMAHLKTHFVVHSMSEGLKPSRCGVCDKGFCHRGALTLHMRTHTSKKISTSHFCDTGC